MTKQPNFDFDSIQKDATELIFRLGRGGAYRQAVLSTDVREYLASVILRQRASLTPDEGSEWRAWDYANESLSEDLLYYPVDADELPEISFLSDIGIIERVASIEEIIDQSDAYFVRFFDRYGKCLVAVRDTQTFKSIFRKPKGMFSVSDQNKMEMLNEPVFQLADKFNFIFDDREILIFSPKMFERIVCLEEKLNETTEKSAEEFCRNCSAFDWPDIGDVARRSRRMSGYLRAIINIGEYGSYDVAKIRNSLDKLGIEYEVSPSGKLKPVSGKEVVLLRFLGHSVYEADLSSAPASKYLARNKSKVTGN